MWMSCGFFSEAAPAGSSPPVKAQNKEVILLSAEQKQKILIVDDSELNRAILADMLDDEYEIIEAENGLQGV